VTNELVQKFEQHVAKISATEEAEVLAAKMLSKNPDLSTPKRSAAIGLIVGQLTADERKVSRAFFPSFEYLPKEKWEAPPPKKKGKAKKQNSEASNASSVAPQSSNGSQSQNAGQDLSESKNEDESPAEESKSTDTTTQSQQQPPHGSQQNAPQAVASMFANAPGADQAPISGNEQEAVMQTTTSADTTRPNLTAAGSGQGTSAHTEPQVVTTPSGSRYITNEPGRLERGRQHAEARRAKGGKGGSKGKKGKN